eukprot:1432609-Rhodomonas_salina.10
MRRPGSHHGGHCHASPASRQRRSHLLSHQGLAHPSTSQTNSFSHSTTCDSQRCAAMMLWRSDTDADSMPTDLPADVRGPTYCPPLGPGAGLAAAVRERLVRRQVRIASRRPGQADSDPGAILARPASPLRSAGWIQPADVRANGGRERVPVGDGA